MENPVVIGTYRLSKTLGIGAFGKVRSPWRPPPGDLGRARATGGRAARRARRDPTDGTARARLSREPSLPRARW